MNILLTGATGFVGTRLSAVLENLHCVRHAARAANPVDYRNTVVVGDIGRDTDWSAALDGIDCVIHLAARVHIMRPSEGDCARYYDTNTEGTARLASSAAAAGVRRFIFMSTIKVNGERTGAVPFRAGDAPQPADDYGKSKLEAERRLLEIAANSPMVITSMRPSLVYGPGVRANFLRLLSAVRAGWPLPLGGLRNARSMISVWNLCDLVKTAIDVPFNGVVLAADGEDLSTPELIRRIAKSMQRPARLVSVPVGAVRALGRSLGKADAISRLCDSLAIDTSATRQALGWSAPMSVDEGLDRTVHWFLRERAHG